MIWFKCQQCGRRHKQPEDAAGSLIFCECGQANRVPWESTVAAPAERAEDEERPRRRKWSDAEEDEGRQPRRRREAAWCLNHEDAAPVHTCPDCGEAFCPRCLVEFQGLRLCGPCKNYRVRRLQRPPRVGTLPVVALIVGLAGAPLVVCITLPSVQGGQPGVVVACAVVGLLIGSAALVLGLLALRETERKAATGGRGLAATGAALGVAALLWSLSLVVLMANRLVQE